MFQHKNIINHIVTSFYITNDKFDKFFHPVVLYENYRICISMNNNENFSNERKYLRKLRDVQIQSPVFHLPCVLVYQT